MTKGKRKRKREKGRQAAQEGQPDRMPRSAVIAQAVGNTVKTGHAQTATNESEGNVKMPTKTGISEWIRNNANSVIALFTIVIAVIAGIQAAIYYSQLRAMRIDQRAWIYPTATGGPTLDKPIVATINLPNTGKTPAKNFQATARVEILDADEGPTFDYSNPLLNTWTVGNLILPNSPAVWPIDIHAKRQISGTTSTEYILFTKDFSDRFAVNKMWFSVEGEVTYKDAFGKGHWIHFCYARYNFSSTERAPKGAKDCATYNDMDDR